MGLNIETWAIAFRNKKEGILDNLEDFTVIKNGIKGWYADPFLFENNGETYLFAEYFSYSLSRGVIVYAVYDEKLGKFGNFKEIIRESYHLSYPQVFKYHDKIFMLPEASGSDSIYLYEAEYFPLKWKKLTPLLTDVKAVDSTAFVDDNKMFIMTLRYKDIDNATLDLFQYSDDNKLLEVKSDITSDMSIARPGGNFIQDNVLYRVSQDCSVSYGYALNLIELSCDFYKHYSEKLVKKILPDNIKLTNINDMPSGIHTYNSSGALEVVDLKFFKNSFYRIIVKIAKKIFRF